MLGSMRRMPRPPLTLRALLLVPLLAVGVDLARATLACGPRAESCLEAAGQGWLGAAGSVLLVLYAIGLALAVGGLARGGPAGRAPGFPRLWLIGTAGVAAVCGGQALLAGALGDGARARRRLGRAARVLRGRRRRCSRSRCGSPPPPRSSSASLRPDAPRLRIAAALVRRRRRGPRRAPRRPLRARHARARAARSARLTAPSAPSRARSRRHLRRRAAHVEKESHVDPSHQARAARAAPRRAHRRRARGGRRQRAPHARVPAARRRRRRRGARRRRRRRVLARRRSPPPPADELRACSAASPSTTACSATRSAPLTVTEYVDLQCPVCAAAARDDAADRSCATTCAPARSKLDARTLHFIGPDSERAARVAAGAERQGKLWPFLEAFYAAPGAGELRLRDRRVPALGRGSGRRRRARRARRSPTARRRRSGSTARTPTPSGSGSTPRRRSRSRAATASRACSPPTPHDAAVASRDERSTRSCAR